MMTCTSIFDINLGIIWRRCPIPEGVTHTRPSPIHEVTAVDRGPGCAPIDAASRGVQLTTYPRLTWQDRVSAAREEERDPNRSDAAAALNPSKSWAEHPKARLLSISRGIGCQ